MKTLEQRPIIPGRPDNFISPLINRVIKEGPEFLAPEWMDNLEPNSKKFYLEYYKNNGKTMMDVLQGVVLSGLMSRIQYFAQDRQPTGLVYDFTRLKKVKGRERISGKLTTLNVRNEDGTAEDPYGVFVDSIYDTLGESLDAILENFERNIGFGILNNRTRAYMRLKQLDGLFSNIEASERPINLLYGGAGTASLISGGVCKVIPSLVEREGMNPEDAQSRVNLYSQIADSTLGTITNIAMIDILSFESIQDSIFDPILRDFHEDLLKYFVLIQTKDGQISLDLSDEARGKINAWYDEAYVDRKEITPRNGCPFRASIESIRSGESARISGVTDLWKYLSKARRILYSDIYLE